MAQIIADHTVVAKYADIPAEYIAAVKCMLFNIPGESHAKGYLNGCNVLMGQESTYACAVSSDSSAPPAYRTDALRLHPGRYDSGFNPPYTSGGEEDFWTNADGISRMKTSITYYETHSLHIAALGFGWCWDMTGDLTGTAEGSPYDCRWGGISYIDRAKTTNNGNWGLDAADEALTGNALCMDSYLSAVEEYRTYCTAQGYTTKIIFTTGPVDGVTGEGGYQRHLKHQYIRDYVAADSTRILFDYADILCWNDSGQENVLNWSANGRNHYYQNIHSDNLADIGEDNDTWGDHIGEVGALRIAKALWWMMAKIAGWTDRDQRIAIGVRNA